MLSSKDLIRDDGDSAVYSDQEAYNLIMAVKDM